MGCCHKPCNWHNPLYKFTRRVSVQLCSNSYTVGDLPHRSALVVWSAILKSVFCFALGVQIIFAFPIDVSLHTLANLLHHWASMFLQTCNSHAKFVHLQGFRGFNELEVSRSNHPKSNSLLWALYGNALTVPLICPSYSSNIWLETWNNSLNNIIAGTTTGRHSPIACRTDRRGGLDKRNHRVGRAASSITAQQQQQSKMSPEKFYVSPSGGHRLDFDTKVTLYNDQLEAFLIGLRLLLINPVGIPIIQIGLYWLHMKW